MLHYLEQLSNGQLCGLSDINIASSTTTPVLSVIYSLGSDYLSEGNNNITMFGSGNTDYFPYYELSTGDKHCS